MNRNGMISCRKCRKRMRSDHLLRHSKIHDTGTEVNGKEQYSKTEGIEELTIEDVREDLLQENKIYLDKIDLGEKISIIIAEGVVQEDCLSKEREEALGLYRKRKPRFDISTSTLKTWQVHALELFEVPTERDVIWICGHRGNEGKSWFQSYIQGLYGFNRVVRLDLRIKHGNLCNVLKKRSLSSVDIFLFNDSRSVSGGDYNLYRILEDIKDGQATASKYDNDNIYFKTPNTVVIFSNQIPEMRRLSKDRWIIFKITKNGLEDITKPTAKRTTNVSDDSDFN